MFNNKIAVITGGTGGIGQTISRRFDEEGAKVCIIDIQPNDYFVGDVADKAVLD